MDIDKKLIIEKLLLSKVKKNLINLEEGNTEINYDMDLLASGIIDSMELVDLLFEIEKKTDIEPRYFLEKITPDNVTINWFLNA